MFNQQTDHFLIRFDRALRVITGQAKASRQNPASNCKASVLTEAEQKHSAGLMRVNHVGEICAQALYDSQAVFSQSQDVKRQFARSSVEEEDHLAWTAERLQELNSHTSVLNPLWYVGAYTCGLIAGRSGDAISLGFVVETEKQVEAHLQSHLKSLPADDHASRAIVEQMRQDEIAHGAAAQALGATNLPAPITLLMQGMAKVMTTTAYHL
ncbi:2-polyprenyl-3-methyl-6-methoxy-1,4-benzoquinone monooxygenase [Undibacterium fentianense]|uniref:3-demethoxyubiquinol 3-hydroxylase n=1 Tax=Undibacterium fentianense TaxID=2828728 RepID=A0A941IDM5_9BURK|nr:2-polyprenyl-3-methyl-6-methoxy-1,4-benzoquinone monooxygenase [Undibacterium fentianense]MBR7801469.1 2-polyprenyl-3-methyl-6-methoxy-1,4-benzoquinone monooxygenase [Undibacterium fentianense]